MRKNTDAVLTAFGNRKAHGQRGSSIWTDGETIYSYRTAIAARLTDSFGVLFNDTRYSVTTSQQQGALRVELRSEIVATFDNLSRGVDRSELVSAYGMALDRPVGAVDSVQQ